MQLSLFSISYAGLWGQAMLDAAAFIRHAAQLGFEAVMLAGKRPHVSPVDVGDEAIAALRGELEGARIRCAAVAAYVDLGVNQPAEVPFLEMQISYVEALCRIAAALGGRHVRVFTAYEAEGRPPHTLWQQTLVALREMCDRAAAHDVTIAVQNHHDLAVDTTALLDLLNEVGRPNCRLGFDAWSPALRGEDLYEAARRAAPLTALTTNADYVRLPRYRYRPEAVNYQRIEPDLVRAVPFGTGFIDYEAFFNGLRDGGFDGIATYEMCSPIRGGGALENLDRCAASYLDWMRRRDR